MQEIYGTPLRIVANAQVHDGEGFIFSMLIGSDTVNDPVVAIHNCATGNQAAANQIVPSATYDASVLGINGVVFKISKRFTSGLYVAIANIGTGAVIIDWRSQGNMFPVKLSCRRLISTRYESSLSFKTALP